jgi:hypothetical protein
VFENRVLRRLFGPKRDEVTRGWRKLHNEEVHNTYSSTSIIRMSKSRRMRWAECVAIMGAKRNAYRIGCWLETQIPLMFQFGGYLRVDIYVRRFSCLIIKSVHYYDKTIMRLHQSM